MPERKKMSGSARIFVTNPMEGLIERSGLDPLSGLRNRADCTIWSGNTSVDSHRWLSLISEAEGILCSLGDPMDSDLIRSCGNLRVISSCSVGVDHVDLAAATRRGIYVGHTPAVLVETTADLAFGLMLAACRRIVESDRFLRRGDWSGRPGWDIAAFVGPDLHGATLGIVGLGAIGRAVARRAQGFGMRVLAWSRSGCQVQGVETVDLERVLAESDFVSIHVALAEETRALIDRRALAAMKPGAVLVNTARGGVVDEMALAEALASGRLAAAGIDVFEREPLAGDHPLVGLENAVLTPHIGSASVGTRIRMLELAVENLLAGLDDRPLPHCANLEELRRAGH